MKPLVQVVVGVACLICVPLALFSGLAVAYWTPRSYSSAALVRVVFSTERAGEASGPASREWMRRLTGIAVSAPVLDRIASQVDLGEFIVSGPDREASEAASSPHDWLRARLKVTIPEPTDSFLLIEAQAPTPAASAELANAAASSLRGAIDSGAVAGVAATLAIVEEAVPPSVFHHPVFVIASFVAAAVSCTVGIVGLVRLVSGVKAIAIVRNLSSGGGRA